MYETMHMHAAKTLPQSNISTVQCHVNYTRLSWLSFQQPYMLQKAYYGCQPSSGIEEFTC